MTISFHCENCKKKVTAPDTAGGKWSKCPACNHRCYIPMPKSEDEEELKLAPIDEEEEMKYERAMRETHNLTGMLLHQTEVPEDSGGKTTSAERELIIKYLRQITAGQLDEAKKTAAQILSSRSKSKAILESMLKSGRPVPELADVPQKVLAGFINSLLAKLK
jgi:DNA-directed RNA polymerase subunit RPC12/RpoP